MPCSAARARRRGPNAAACRACRTAPRQAPRQLRLGRRLQPLEWLVLRLGARPVGDAASATRRLGAAAMGSPFEWLGFRRRSVEIKRAFHPKIEGWPFLQEGGHPLRRTDA